MRLVTTCEHRFDRLPDGSVWTADVFPYEYWAPYLAAFEDVRIVARTRLVAPEQVVGKRRTDGPHVTIHSVPYYVGPAQFLRSIFAVRRAIGSVLLPGDAVILRGGQLASILRGTSLTGGRPYACEVGGDPHDVFAPGVVRHPLRPILRWWFARELRAQCRGAATALYVTESYLQKRYPSGGPMFSASDVQLGPGSLLGEPRIFHAPPRPLKLVTVGSLDQYYKGQDVAIGAVAELTRRGCPVQLTFVGGGRLREELASLAQASGIADRVFFAGPVPAGDAVRAQLDAADLFILPSRTEGLPRALIEAMARALPAVASSIGGIPELLDAGDLVPPGDAVALAGHLQAALEDPSRLSAMSARNLERARRYSQERVLAVRGEFLRAVRDRTARWTRS